MIGHIQEQLPELLTLARDRSEDARVSLAGKLADIFLTEGVNMTPREEDLFNDLMEQLLRSKSREACNELVRRFSNAAKMPRKMAMTMACEAIEIARPVLQNNENLTDEDLITVVQTQSVDHAEAVAARKKISEAVADALVATGSIEVMMLVAENLGAKLSKKAVEILVEAARMNNILQRPLVCRPEMTEETAAKMCWWLEQELRRQTIKRFGISSGQLDIALATAIDEKLGGHIFEKHDEEAMVKVADWLGERGALTVKVLPQLLRQGHYRLFNIALSRLTELGLDLIDLIVGESGGRALSAVARALDIDKTNFVSIFLLSRGARTDKQIVHPRELSNALAAFDRVQPKVAREMLSSWRQNPDYLKNLGASQNDVA